MLYLIIVICCIEVWAYYPTHYKPIYAITFTISNYKVVLIFIQMYHINGVEGKFEKSYNKGHNATIKC